MAKNKDKRKDKTIPTLDDVIIKKPQDEKKESIPVAEDIPEEDVVEEPVSEPAGNEKTVAETGANAEAEQAPVAKEEASATTRDKEEDTASRRVGDRRNEDVPLAEGEPDRRVSQRRREGSKASDLKLSEEMMPMIEKILKDMVPDLEEHIQAKLSAEAKKIVSNILPELKQHIRMQLRFEIDKHMTKWISRKLNPED